MEINNDLISRSALRSEMYHEAFEKDSDEQRWDDGCWIRYKMFERVVDGQPPAQPEIIRCKDCKHRPYKDEDGDVRSSSWDDETCPCTCDDSYYNWMPEDDFFCWRGERREDLEAKS